MTQWLVLFHHLPPKPDYLRVKLRRRLARLHAVPLRNSVYVLPHRAETLEDLQWLSGEIRADGGDAILCQTQFVDGVTDEEIIARFDESASDRYAAIADEARALLEHTDFDDLDSAARVDLQRAHARLARQLDDVARGDFFSAAAGEQARREVDALDSATIAKRHVNAPSVKRGSVWVTRAGVFVDRMASAWLIRRFIDPDARFKFVRTARYTALAGETRFDMPRAEFTHEGDECTFEVLCRRFALTHAGLADIGEIVHDIDLKDDKFGRVEADGIAAVLRGITETIADDSQRIAAAASVFDGLFAQFRSRS
jgi:hypothetical protein